MGARSELTVIVTVDGVSLTLVTRIQAHGPTVVPTTSVCWSTAR